MNITSVTERVAAISQRNCAKVGDVNPTTVVKVLYDPKREELYYSQFDTAEMAERSRVDETTCIELMRIRSPLTVPEVEREVMAKLTLMKLGYDNWDYAGGVLARASESSKIRFIECTDEWIRALEALK